MPLDVSFGTVSFYAGFAWMYGIKRELWEAAAESYQKNFTRLKKPHLITLIDYGRDSSARRLWTLGFFGPVPTLLAHCRVAHGCGASGNGQKDSPASEAKISNTRGSNRSSVGGFVTHHIYSSGLGQKDKSKKRPALVLEGLDTSNSNARSRGIRMHGAWYVSETGSMGRSHGCICCQQDIHEALIQIIQGGSFLYAYKDAEHVSL